MTIIDIIILIITLLIVAFISYRLFFKKGRSVCQGCPNFKKCASNGDELKKYYEQCNKQINK